MHDHEDKGARIDGDEALVQVTSAAEGVALVTLNRPHRLNAYNQDMATELDLAFKRLDGDDGVRAIVVTGAGRAFCAGQDLSGGGSSFGESVSESYRRRTEEQRLRSWDMRTPVLAAMNGHAIGIGVTMTLQWDIRVVAEDAKLALPFTRRGIVPDGLSLWTLPHLIGEAAATELFVTGRTFSGAEAAQLGLVHRAVPAEDVSAVTVGMAAEIASECSPIAVALTKALLARRTWSTDLPGFEWNVERPALGWIAQQADAAEGAQAFLERRPARWPTRKTADLSEALGDDGTRSA